MSKAESLVIIRAETAGADMPFKSIQAAVVLLRHYRSINNLLAQSYCCEHAEPANSFTGKLITEKIWKYLRYKAHHEIQIRLL